MVASRTVLDPNNHAYLLLWVLLKVDLRRHRADAVYGLLEQGLSFLELVGVSPEDVTRALRARWLDFEDCLVSQCAEKVKADFIITRNIKDFDKSPIPAITPEELFEKLANQGIRYAEVSLA